VSDYRIKFCKAAIYFSFALQRFEIYVAKTPTRFSAMTKRAKNLIE